MINTICELKDLCKRIESSPSVAIDTEFISGEAPKTILSVVQVGFNHQDVFLIDALAFEDLNILRPVLESEDIIKIMHDGGQDLELISQSSGAIPQNIFDIKLGARLLGAGTNYSLSEIVHTFCGIGLSKEQQRSDWLLRPLSDAQISYAEQDVKYLPEIQTMIRSQAEKMGRLHWIDEDMLKFNDPNHYTPLSPSERILRSSMAHFFEPSQRAVLVALTEWRSQVSEILCITPKQLIKDGEILRLATRRITKPASVGRVCRSLPRRYQAEVAKLIRKALKTPKHHCPSSFAQSPLKGIEIIKRRLLQTVVDGCALDHGIQPDLIASKSVLNDLVLNPDMSDSILLHGWRRELIGNDLLRVLEGSASVELNQGSIKLRSVRH
ncbi:MAG: hypothetical protein OXE59_03785 [Bacteroidetes bacterium]|nr:hypothetical protein [Bacteroidota bacterium]